MPFPAHAGHISAFGSKSAQGKTNWTMLGDVLK